MIFIRSNYPPPTSFNMVWYIRPIFLPPVCRILNLFYSFILFTVVSFKGLTLKIFRKNGLEKNVAYSVNRNRFFRFYCKNILRRSFKNLKEKMVKENWCDPPIYYALNKLYIIYVCSTKKSNIKPIKGHLLNFNY